jgi:hypothetical protein
MRHLIGFFDFRQPNRDSQQIQRQDLEQNLEIRGATNFYISCYLLGYPSHIFSPGLLYDYPLIEAG